MGKYVFSLLIFTVCACGPLKPYPIEGGPEGGAKLPTTIGSVPPDPSLPLASSGRYLTTSGGYFSMAKVMTATLSSNRRVWGLDSDGNFLYVLIRTDQGGGIVRWNLMRTELNGGTWVELCSFLDDNYFNGGLVLNGNGFTTFGNRCNGCSPTRQFLRHFSMSCVEGAQTAVPGQVMTYTYSNYNKQPTPSYLGGKKFGFGTEYNGYQIYDFATQSFEPGVSSVSLAGDDIHLSSGTATRFNSTTGWAMDDKLWKLDRKRSPIAWGKLPSTTYPYLSAWDTAFLAPAGPNHLAILSVSNGAFYVFVLDVTNF